MAEELIISISGMRGIIGENFTPEIACRYAGAFGTYIKRKNADKTGKIKICVGRDSRGSGQMIYSAVAAGLASVGIDVIDLGIISTPGVGVMVSELGCDGGVIITASHNPIPYNGIKLLTDKAVAPSPEMANKIIEMYHNDNIDFVDSPGCGHITADDRTDSIHIEKVLNTVNAETIKAKKFKVVLDSVNGAGGKEGVKLLQQLGCTVVKVNYDPTGIFAHKPEPTKDNLVSLSKQVKEHNADIGFAQDPDADRLAIVDENGTYIGEEYTLALAVKHLFKANPGSKAAANLSTSRMIDDIADESSGKIIRTAVGEANVAKAMMENNCIIGGEGNGGVIDLRVGPIRNSLVAMAIVLELIAENGKSVSQTVSDIPSYCMIKDKFKITKQQASSMLAEIQKQYPSAKINSCDGCRFDFDDGWLHLRSSNTEPIMRAIAEAKDKQKAEEYIETINKMRERLFNLA